ncbi:DUF4268 domain-containing protein [Chryseolinea sp. H1M3-3]|uniref:DUF4268 domain-containing protein n=1 Tax=Chryseolinea sp. H1M3-3 TaxID=3034144 RepID=UPI0023EBFA89|nr:DUF4268 domain-containing protein [Chryseolinea sp. H1M3-3]
MELGELRAVSARQKWTSEAREFTPWLFQNIEQLNEAIGVELEVENMEVACGPYAADILAKDTGTGKYVVIENQLERTDHDHLGKALTYVSVLDASTIVWIATEFTEEHIKALDWLNDHTTEDISFYGVQIELWQIDDSKPALKFQVLSKPNEAVRQAARTKSSEELSDSKKFQFDFWTKLRAKLEKTKRIPSLQSPAPQYWYNIALGRAHCHLSITCNTDQNTVGVRVYIGNKVVDTILPYLETKKEEIEKMIGQKLLWNPNPQNRDKIIVLHHVTDFDNEKKIEEALDWLVEYTIRFQDAFRKALLQMNGQMNSSLTSK